MSHNAMSTTTTTTTTSVGKDATGCFQNIRQILISRGIPQQGADIILSSWRQSTKKQYGSYIKKWFSFCDREQVDKFDPDIISVVKFLSHLFSNGTRYSGVNTARSAISSIKGVLKNKDIGNNVLITRFMKGIFNKKPSLPRYGVTWNVSSVLQYLNNMNNYECSIRELSMKLASLLLLATGQRCQTLLCLDTRNIEFGGSYIKIRIGDLLKQSRPSYHLQELYIEPFDSNVNLCVIKCLDCYLQRTASYRKHSVLLLSTVKPHKPASKGYYIELDTGSAQAKWNRSKNL